MILTFHTQALAILYYLQKAGFEAYIVGGAVRDVFLRAHLPEDDERRKQIKSYDYDFTTNATPEQIQAVFPESFYENDFGTVSLPAGKLKLMLDELQVAVAEVVIPEAIPELQKSPRIIDLAKATKIHESLVERDLPENEEAIAAVEMEEAAAKAVQAPQTDLTNENFEITTYRSGEVYEQDFRHPSQMSWGKTIEEDLGRRDFTINAMAVKVRQDWLEEIFETPPLPLLPAFLQLNSEHEAELTDKYEGLTDLQNGLLRCVGEPPMRFNEDALRMLRAIRFSVQLDLEIEEQTWGALKLKADLIRYVSWERIRDELLKMLASPAPAQAIVVLDQTGLLEYILPELLAAKGVDQRGHHTTDVWTHSLDALFYCPSKDPIVRLAALLHDIGKPATQRWVDGCFTFYNHQHVGAKMASKIGRRLRLSKHDCDRLYNLVSHHMFHYQPGDTDASIRRLMKDVGLENLDDLLAIREGDRLGSGAAQTSWRLEELKERMIEQLNQPFDVRDLEINGYDLMTELELKPGRILGELLNYLLEIVLDDADLNEREILLEKAREYLKAKETTVDAAAN